MGIIERAVLPTTKTTVSNLRSEVFFINASKSGIFIPLLEHNVTVLKGEKLGEIIDPLSRAIQETLISPCNGLLFTIREYPVVYEGSLLARILEPQRGYWTMKEEVLFEISSLSRNPLKVKGFSFWKRGHDAELRYRRPNDGHCYRSALDCIATGALFASA